MMRRTTAKREKVTEKPWYLEPGADAKAERIRRGLEATNGDVLCLTAWEIEREDATCRRGEAA